MSFPFPVLLQSCSCYPQFAYGETEAQKGESHIMIGTGSPMFTEVYIKLQ